MTLWSKNGKYASKQYDPLPYDFGLPDPSKPALGSGVDYGNNGQTILNKKDASKGANKLGLPTDGTIGKLFSDVLKNNRRLNARPMANGSAGPNGPSGASPQSRTTGIPQPRGVVPGSAANGAGQGVGWYGKTVEDFIAQAMGMIPQNSDLYASQEAAARSNHSDVSARLAALYSVMNEEMGKEVGKLDGRSQEIQQGITDSTSQLTGLLNDSAASMQASTEQSLRENGNQGAEGLLANYRTADSNVDAMSRAVSQGQNGLERERMALNFGKVQGRNNLAGLASEHGTIQAGGSRNLLTQLADIDTARLTAERERRAMALQQAQSLYDQDYGRFTDSTNYNQGMERDSWDRAQQIADRNDAATAAQNEFNIAQMEAEASAGQGTPIKAEYYNAARQMLATSTGDALDPAAVMRLAKQLAGQQTGGSSAGIRAGNGTSRYAQGSVPHAVIQGLYGAGV